MATGMSAIDLAEDRDRFKRVLDKAVAAVKADQTVALYLSDMADRGAKAATIAGCRVMNLHALVLALRSDGITTTEIAAVDPTGTIRIDRLRASSCAHCSASASVLPSWVDAKPHCGLIASCPTSTTRRAMPST